MEVRDIGVATHLTRVERWECDFNDHWNARFYARAFAMAAATSAGGLAGEESVERHLRFHRELLLGASVEVRSARLEGGKRPGAIVHLLFGDDRLAAVAVDIAETAGGALPAAPAETLRALLPRNIEPLTDVRPKPEDGAVRHSLGVIGPADVDHLGSLLFDKVIAFVAVVCHSQLAALGYTMEFTRKTGIGRMAAEIGVRQTRNGRAGALAQSSSWVRAVAEKSFTLEHQISTREGDAIATVRQTLLAVDMTTRRSVRAPDFLRRQV